MTLTFIFTFMIQERNSLSYEEKKIPYHIIYILKNIKFDKLKKKIAKYFLMVFAVFAAK